MIYFLPNSTFTYFLGPSKVNIFQLSHIYSSRNESNLYFWGKISKWNCVGVPTELREWRQMHFALAGQDSRRTIGQMRTSRLRKCQFFILCKYILSISILDGSPSDVIGCSPERRYDHRSMGRKWIGGNIFPYSFQIGHAGEAANVDIGWKRQNNKKTGQCFFFPCIPVSNVAASLIIDLYDIISF